jgi:hypothetical protein
VRRAVPRLAGGARGATARRVRAARGCVPGRDGDGLTPRGWAAAPRAAPLAGPPSPLGFASACPPDPAFLVHPRPAATSVGRPRDAFLPWPSLPSPRCRPAGPPRLLPLCALSALTPPWMAASGPLLQLLTVRARPRRSGCRRPGRRPAGPVPCKRTHHSLAHRGLGLAGANKARASLQLHPCLVRRRQHVGRPFGCEPRLAMTGSGEPQARPRPPPEAGMWMAPKGSGS